MTFWQRLRSVLLRRPEPNDERSSQAAAISAVNHDVAKLRGNSAASAERAERVTSAILGSQALRDAYERATEQFNR